MTTRIPPLLFLAMALAMVGLAGMARADGRADFDAATAELQKQPDQQNAALIDAKLASAVSAPDKIECGFYQQARLLQEQRRVAAMADKTPPQRRQVLNQSCQDIIAEIGKFYLADDNQSEALRRNAYQCQIVLAWSISDSFKARAIEADIAKVMLADLDGRYISPANVPPDAKRAAIQAALQVGANLHDAAKRREFTLNVYDRLVRMDTAAARIARIDRALLRASGGENEAAQQDFQTVLDDPASGEDLRYLARRERMRFFIGQSKWTDAKTDAEAISKLPIKLAVSEIFDPFMAAQAKYQALRVLMANGALDQAGLTAAADELCLEMLSADNLSAEGKSLVIAELFMDRATDQAGRYKWDAALGWAKAAYDTAPNPRVYNAVNLIQQILANRSRKPFGADEFSLTKIPKDLDAAASFYARQSGTKKNGDAVVTLLPDLSNQDQFPRQLTGLAAPMSDALKAGMQKAAVDNPDPMTRALAWGLLGNPDKAIEVMSGAINDLGLESPRTPLLVNYMARFVRAKFESVALGNAFLLNQVEGPAGKDGKPGTADDRPNPLDAAKVAP